MENNPSSLMQSSKSYDDQSTSGLWDTAFDDNESVPGSTQAKEHHQSILDGVCDDEFLTMQVSASGSADDDDAWSLMDDENEVSQLEQLPSLYHEQLEAPRTPSPHREERVQIRIGSDLHQITPEQLGPLKVCIQDSSELQIKYQRTLQQLAKSMRRSEETRTFVKRQRLSSPTLSEGDSRESSFSGPRASAIEESRQKLYLLINKGVLSI